MRRLAKPAVNTDSKLDVAPLLAGPVAGLMDHLGTSQETGLSSEEARQRLLAFGPNELAVTGRRNKALRFLAGFKNPLVLILLIAGLITGITGDAATAGIIFTIIIFSTILAFYQENKAENSAESLRQKVVTNATVIRDEKKADVPLRAVVRGDVIYLSAGDIVPADARVITVKDFYIDQSALTGESFPVEKSASPLATGASQPAEWSNYLFMGTAVISGTATAVVVNTGGATEYGEIARRLASRDPETEYTRGLRHFGYLITEMTIFLTIFVFLINAYHKRDALQSLLFAVALAVGLTPELLPMIVTVNLSSGALKMSKKDVIVKRLSSIQELGSMDVLCTDKTGTLTEAKIELTIHVDPVGNDDKSVLELAYLNSHFNTGIKSPMDDGILTHEQFDMSGWRKVDEIPFDFIRRRLSIVAEKDGRRSMVTKGAFEEVLSVCDRVRLGGGEVDLAGEVLFRVHGEYERLSEEGYRVLGVAVRGLTGDREDYQPKDEAKMVFLGFVAFMDPPKASTREALKLLKEAGVELKVLTGDNELVTKHVCAELGFEIKGIVLGPALSDLREDALRQTVEKANVFARVTPAQKDLIMAALKKNGHVVGFMGDGINDAPSLKTADVGISVDTAVDVAKESADVILGQKDLKVLNEGVLEGRRTFGNTMKYLMMGTSSNLGNMFSVAGASLFLPFLPMLPIQILLNSFLYDLSELSIPTDNVDDEYIKQPKKWDVGFLRRYTLVFGPVSSIFDFLMFYLLLQVFFAGEALFQTAWFIESMATQGLIIFVIRTRRIPFYSSRPGVLLVLSTLLMVAFGFLLPFTPLGSLFQFTPPPVLIFPAIIIIIAVYLVTVEAVKAAFYRKERRDAPGRMARAPSTP